jgi:hypothetical protein
LQLEEDFAALHPETHDLKSCWPEYREKVLVKARDLAEKDTDLRELLQQNFDDLDEGL